MDREFAGIRAGESVLGGTPLMIDEYVRSIPSGDTTDVAGDADTQDRRVEIIFTE